MNKVIYKYPLSTGVAEQYLSMPENAQILSIQMQDGTPQLWALIDLTQPYVPRKIKCFGTGHTISTNPGFHIGTVHSYGLVWHYFED